MSGGFLIMQIVLLWQIVFDFRVTLVFFQIPKHCQTVSSMQDTRSCCTGATLVICISALAGRQTPFLPIHFLFSFICTFYFFMKLFSILKLFCNKVKGIHIINIVQQAKKKSRTPITIYGRSLHISQRVLEWQAPLDFL